LLIILKDPKSLDPKKFDFFSKEAMLDLEIDKEFGDYVGVDDMGEVDPETTTDELVSLLEKASLKRKNVEK
jgi:hypothetical protein